MTEETRKAERRNREARNENICRRYAVGDATLREIGLDYGLSHEAVRQIVRRAERRVNLWRHSGVAPLSGGPRP